MDINSKPNNHIAKQIIDSAHKIKTVLNSVLDDGRLTGMQARILGFLMINTENGREIYQKDIEKEFKISRSSVTSVLNYMEEGGFIIRQSVKDDARLKRIVLTDKALQTGERTKGKIDKFEEKITENFTDREKELLITLLSKAVGNLEYINREEIEND